jgi:hypothetical protein
LSKPTGIVPLKRDFEDFAIEAQAKMACRWDAKM